MTNFRKRAQMEMVDQMFESKKMRGELRNAAINEGIKEELADDTVNNLWIKLKNFSTRGELPTDPEHLRSYIFAALQNLVVDTHRRNARYREKLMTDRGWEGGSLRGEDVSQEEMADLGYGSFPSNPEDKILLDQMHSQFGPEGTALGKMDKEDMRNLMDLTGGLGELNPERGESATLHDVAKKIMKDKEGFDWNAEMRAAREIHNPEEREMRMEELEDKLETAANTIGRRLSRGQEKMREYAKASIEDLRSLTKVATKLDSLGLTKEADYIDSLIRKISST